MLHRFGLLLVCLAFGAVIYFWPRRPETAWESLAKERDDQSWWMKAEEWSRQLIGWPPARELLSPILPSWRIRLEPLDAVPEPE
jgi:hypothetical protein